MIDPMIAPSARARGFTIGRILSQWPDIVGEMASWCRPDAVAFPRDSRSDGTLRLQIASGRGPQAQAMSQVIIDRVNANFGYQAISRISLVQTLVDQPASPPPAPAPASEPLDIWTLDDKLKDVKFPELRAALRQLGSPVGSPVSSPVDNDDDRIDDDRADNPNGDATHTASIQPPSD